MWQTTPRVATQHRQEALTVVPVLATAVLAAHFLVARVQTAVTADVCACLNDVSSMHEIELYN
jgi:hypothetical protein